MFKKISIVIIVIFISGLSGIIADRFLFPYLSTTDFFQKREWLKKTTENVTVINKTQQVYVKEDSSVAKLMSPVVSSVVNIISYSNPDLKIIPSRDESKNGTGVIATSDGIIMTYASAIDYDQAADKAGTTIPKYKYKVMTADGNSYDADFLGVDSWSNLAFLKIDATNLPVVSFGNFSDYNAGEKVIAIGNDYADYQNRFSAGILNSFNPTFNTSGGTFSVAEKEEGVYMTDFGAGGLSVGGPIVDYSGQIVGIIGAVQKENSLNYFQLPSNKIQLALNKVIQKQLSSNPVLGVYYIPVTKTLKVTRGLSVDSGAMVYSSSGQQGLAVILGSPAAKAGLKIGDIITKVGDANVNLENNLSTILYSYKKGDKIQLTVMRAEQEIKVEVQL